MLLANIIQRSSNTSKWGTLHVHNEWNKHGTYGVSPHFYVSYNNACCAFGRLYCNLSKLLKARQKSKSIPARIIESFHFHPPLIPQ